MEDEQRISFEDVELVDAINTGGALSKLKSGVKIALELLRADANVYFTSSDNMIPGIVNLYCSIAGKRHFHRTVHTRELDGSLIRKNLLKGAIHRTGIRNADHVFVQAKEHEKMLEDITNADTTILKNCFPLESFENNQQRNQTVLWIGRRVTWKRPELFLDLAEKFESEQFVMISPKTGDKERFYESIEDRANSIDNLELIERVSRDKIGEYFKRSKLFVNTSVHEGFPNTFVESGIYSTPIVSLTVNPDNFLNEYETGLVSGNKFEQMCQNLNLLLSDENLRHRMGKNMRQYVEENHSLKDNIREIEKALETD